MRYGDWIQTFSGRHFWPLDAREDDIYVVDIAHALANQCRYTGHVLRFYSVAQHSVLVSEAVPQEYALWGLLHDAAEAYLSDVARPVKHDSSMAAYRQAEKDLMYVICRKFDLPVEEPSIVKEADVRLSATEWRDLMAIPPITWRIQAEPLPIRIDPWPPDIAKQKFLDRYGDLV